MEGKRWSVMCGESISVGRGEWRRVGMREWRVSIAMSGVSEVQGRGGTGFIGARGRTFSKLKGARVGWFVVIRGGTTERGVAFCTKGGGICWRWW